MGDGDGTIYREIKSIPKDEMVMVDLQRNYINSKIWKCDDVLLKELNQTSNDGMIENPQMS